MPKFTTTAKRGTPRAAIVDNRVSALVSSLNDKTAIVAEHVRVRAVSESAAALMLPVTFKHGSNEYRIEIPVYIGKRGSRDSNALSSAFAFSHVNGAADSNGAFEFLNAMLSKTGEFVLDKAALAVYDTTASAWYLSLSMRESDTVVSKVRGIINAGDIFRALKRHDAIISSNPATRARSIAEAADVPEVDI